MFVNNITYIPLRNVVTTSFYSDLTLKQVTYFSSPITQNLKINRTFTVCFTYSTRYVISHSDTH